MPTTSHPSTEDLIAFAQGALAEPRAMAVEVHMALCEQCAAAVANAPSDGFIEQLRSAERSSLGANLDAKLDSGERQATPAFGAAKPSPRSAKNNSKPRHRETVDWQPEDGLDHLPPDLRTNPRLQFKRRLATGAMGTVYSALDRKNGQMVAVKVLNAKWGADSKQKRRFLDEARLATRLRHPNIAQILQHEPFGQTAFFTMELIAGETLADIVARRGPLPIANASSYVRQAALGLQYAHDHRVIHRDIKPHNLMVESNTGRIKILDFGLGRLTDEHRTGTRLTKEGEILGTLGYLSPEQANDSRQTDARSDIYGLGCTFFFLLTGRPPFQADSAVRLLAKHAGESPPPIGSLRPDVPAAVAALVDRMLAKKPKNRPQSAAEVVLALGNPTKAVPSPNPRAPRAAAISNRQRLIHLVVSPAVVLPLLTVVICLAWLLFH